MDTDDDDPLARAYALGLEHEKAGRFPQAAAAYREVLELDPEDHAGAAVRLASMRQGADPAIAPPAYVATLFDQHADAFERILVDELGYGIPWTIAERLEALGAGPFARLLDLGCGTGLVAEALEGRVGHATGVDLSEGMLEVADDKGDYAVLFAGDAAAFLEQAEGQTWDLIAAADVLPYLGETAALFAGAAARLAPGGWFVFSTETLPTAQMEGRPWRVGPHQRYAHDPAVLATGLAAAGLAVVEITPVTVRHETGVPVAGHLVVARLSSA